VIFDRELTYYGYIAGAVVPLLEMLFVVVPLGMTAFKIRRFKSTYGLQVNTKKLTLHFSICVLLLTLFILELFQNMQLIDTYLQDDANYHTDQYLKDGIHQALVWQIVLQSNFLIYTVAVSLLLIDFLRPPKCSECQGSPMSPCDHIDGSYSPQDQSVGSTDERKR